VGIRGAEAAAGLDAVAEAVSGRRPLLVVDNCEHVLEPVRRACGQLAGRVADLRVLATSRHVLRVAGEQVYPVPSLALPPDGAPRPSLWRDLKEGLAFVADSPCSLAALWLALRKVKR